MMGFEPREEIEMDPEEVQHNFNEALSRAQADWDALLEKARPKPLMWRYTNAEGAILKPKLLQITLSN